MAERAGITQNMIVIVWIMAAVTGLHASATVDEFCMGEAFQANCGHGEVVVMKSAIYGRMRLGRCISKDLGYLGCQADVLGRMHQLCSGRQKCDVPYIVAVLTDIDACPKDVNSYLEASYSCIKVANPTDSKCELQMQGEPFPLARGYLSNKATKKHRACGSHSHPIIINVASTQKIGFTLLDFSSPSDVAEGSRCIKYGSIAGNSGSQDICSVKEGKDKVLTATGRRIEVRLNKPSANNGRHFLLGYAVVGCPEPTYPHNMWIKRAKGHVTIGCYSSRDTWRLDCVNNTWHGMVGNCTQKKDVPVKHEIWTPAPGNQQVESVEPNSSPITPGLAVVMAVTGGLVFSLLLLAVGLLFDKSKRNNRTPESSILTQSTCTLKRSPGVNTDQQHGYPDQRMMTNDRKVYIGNGVNTVGSMASCTTCPEYDVPHYYELDPNYSDTAGFDRNENVRQPLVYTQVPRAGVHQLRDMNEYIDKSGDGKLNNNATFEY